MELLHPALHAIGEDEAHDIHNATDEAADDVGHQADHG